MFLRSLARGQSGYMVCEICGEKVFRVNPFQKTCIKECCKRVVSRAGDYRRSGWTEEKVQEYIREETKKVKDMLNG